MHEVLFGLIPLAGDGYNPLKGVKPSLGPFAKALGPKIAMLLALIWFLCLCVGVAFLMSGIIKYSKSRHERRPEPAAEGALDIGMPASGLMLLGILPLIVSALT